MLYQKANSKKNETVQMWRNDASALLLWNFKGFITSKQLYNRYAVYSWFFCFWFSLRAGLKLFPGSLFGYLFAIEVICPWNQHPYCTNIRLLATTYLLAHDAHIKVCMRVISLHTHKTWHHLMLVNLTKCFLLDAWMRRNLGFAELNAETSAKGIPARNLAPRSHHAAWILTRKSLLQARVIHI